MYGTGYQECSSSSKESKDRLCCSPEEECCKKTPNEGAVCCSKEMCGKDKKDRCYTCDVAPEDDLGRNINYCKVNDCPEPLQLCSVGIIPRRRCCKAKPDEYCGEAWAKGGLLKVPICATHDGECPGGKSEECRDPKASRKKPYLCCKTGWEKCTEYPFAKGVWFCNPSKCKYGEPCKGSPGTDYEGIDKCCDKGEECFNHPSGYAKCFARKPKESTVAGEIVSTSSFSIYLYRNPTGEEFQRSGIAYRFRPHGLQFSKNITINIKDFQPQEVLYKYPDESYIDSCSVKVLKEWPIVVGPAGKSIVNEYFELQIPPGALSKDTAITIDRITIGCPQEGCGPEPAYPPTLEAIKEYYQGDLTKEELQAIINEWVESGVKMINFNNYPVSQYATGEYSNPKILSLEDAGATLHIAGNAWKKIDFPYTITPKTVIEFDFKSDMEGAIQGIGLDTDLTASPKYTFKLYGTRWWGRLKYDNYKSSDGWKHYKIPVGRYYTGNFAYLFFVNADDAHAVADSYFKNLKVYEE